MNRQTGRTHLFAIFFCLFGHRRQIGQLEQRQQQQQQQRHSSSSAEIKLSQQSSFKFNLHSSGGSNLLCWSSVDCYHSDDIVPSFFFLFDIAPLRAAAAAAAATSSSSSIRAQSVRWWWLKDQPQFAVVWSVVCPQFVTGNMSGASLRIFLFFFWHDMTRQAKSEWKGDNCRQTHSELLITLARELPLHTRYCVCCVLYLRHVNHFLLSLFV